MFRNITIFRELSHNAYTKSSYNDYTKSSYDEYKKSIFNDFTKTITNIIFRILIATFLNAITIFSNMINSNEIIVKSTMIKTFITKIVSIETITKTHIHFAIFMIIVTINIFCTCDENELFAIDKTLCHLNF